MSLATARATTIESLEETITEAYASGHTDGFASGTAVASQKIVAWLRAISPLVGGMSHADAVGILADKIERGDWNT